MRPSDRFFWTAYIADLALIALEEPEWLVPKRNCLLLSRGKESNPLL